MMGSEDNVSSTQDCADGITDDKKATSAFVYFYENPGTIGFYRVGPTGEIPEPLEENRGQWLRRWISSKVLALPTLMEEIEQMGKIELRFADCISRAFRDMIHWRMMPRELIYRVSSDNLTDVPSKEIPSQHMVGSEDNVSSTQDDKIVVMDVNEATSAVEVFHVRWGPTKAMPRELVYRVSSDNLTDVPSKEIPSQHMVGSEDNVPSTQDDIIGVVDVNQATSAVEGFHVQWGPTKAIIKFPDSTDLAISKRQKMKTLGRWRQENKAPSGTEGSFLIQLTRDFLGRTALRGIEENLTFNEIYEAVIDEIPRDLWMIFVRRRLNLDDNVLNQVSLESSWPGLSKKENFGIFQPWILHNQQKFMKRNWEDFAYGVAGNKEAWTWFLGSRIGRKGVEHLKGDVGIVTRRLKMATLQRWKLKNNDAYDTKGTVLILLAREFLEVTRPLGNEENLPFAVICKAVIDAIPHDSWMRFVRLKLKLGENAIKALKRKNAGFSEEQKYQILKQWVLNNQDFHREDAAAE